jgi:hypothetical protein
MAFRVSPLSRTVSRDGYTVHIHIFKGDRGGWLLEVVDPAGYMTGWTKSFRTDQAALDEAAQAIEKEGITSFLRRFSSEFPWLPDKVMH